MGVSASTMEAQKAEQYAQHPIEGKWVWDTKTGYRWVTPPILSDSTITKKPAPYSLPGLPSEIGGPYTKQFTKSAFGGQVFTPPESVDGVPLLCQCRHINEYVRDEKGGRIFNAEWALLTSKTPPACWEDTSGFAAPYGGLTFTVQTRHPAFYEYMASSQGAFGVISSFLGGKRTRTRTQTKKARIAKRHEVLKKTRKQK